MSAYYFTVEDGKFLWLLFSIPILIFAHLYFMHHARRKAILFGNFKTLERITGKKILTKNLVLLFLRIVIIVCLILAAAGTSFWMTGERGPNDIVMIIDASASMTTDDMGGTRIDAAKNAAIDFVDQLTLSAKIGIVQFSGLSEIVLIPTENKNEVKSAIESVRVKPVGGSDIAAAVVTASNLLADSDKGRVIVILADGVAALSLYDDDPIPQALSYARERNIVIHTIGIGTQTTGSFIPGIEAQAIIFDEENLRLMAESTGGEYAWARDSVQLQGAFSRVAGEGATGFIETRLALILVLVAIAALFIEWGLLNTRFRLLP